MQRHDKRRMVKNTAVNFAHSHTVQHYVSGRLAQLYLSFLLPPFPHQKEGKRCIIKAAKEGMLVVEEEEERWWEEEGGRR